MIKSLEKRYKIYEKTLEKRYKIHEKTLEKRYKKLEKSTKKRYKLSMLEREILQRLNEWKNTKPKKALLIDGARQIGKTSIIREFARNNYSNFLEINFILQPQAAAVFESGGTADEIVTALTAFSSNHLEKGKSLVFLDEIQECPMARTAIKTLVQDGRFDYIESGSLLGIQYKEVPSYPVGFEEKITMYPMNFYEFCLANSVPKETLSYLETCWNEKSPVQEAVHQKMMQLFEYYIIVGGMPEAVQKFVDSRDIAQVVQVQKDILELYRQDITKYSKNDKLRIKQIFDAIPSELNKHNSRFMLSDLNKNARTIRYESSFMWLSDAGVSLPCYNLEVPLLPFKINELRNLFKLFLCDTGLLCAMSMENVQFEILRHNLEVNMGSIVENIVAQILTANEFELYYYDKKNFGELDFVVQKGADVIPIEIKSGDDFTKHAAINHVLAKGDWNIKKGIVFCKGNFFESENLLYAPLYSLMFFKQDSIKKNLVVPEILF